MRQKKLRIRQLLAEKEAWGICSATQDCHNLVTGAGFCCNNHKKLVNILAQALDEKKAAGTLRESSVKNLDEFALLLEREQIYLDIDKQDALNKLARAFNNPDEDAVMMDTEFVNVDGQLVGLDVTIERPNGDEVLSTRVDWNVETEDLRTHCTQHASNIHCVAKVYGRSKKTWGLSPEHIGKTLREAGVSSNTTI
ncbi:hypothetical protein Daus18300_012525 [Diaporthe australafricana]|uniref:Exonuclease n=1 Tax=Diaporthe australafricana TaxID=127596 RepID=A0ABR3W2E5_9PEZI